MEKLDSSDGELNWMMRVGMGMCVTCLFYERRVYFRI
jgi:hypothetical protein